MAHVHGHHANHASSSRVLTWALGANGALLVVQVLGVLASWRSRRWPWPADAVHDAQIVAAELETRLAEQGVAHATLALECHPCHDPESRDC